MAATTITEIRKEIESIVKIWSGKSAPSMFIWGKPGLGKSSMVKQMAKDLGLEFVDVRLSQLSPTDLRGLPVVNRETGTMSWAPPNFLPKADAAPGILFLDEFNMAGSAMQSISQQLILDRQIGDYVLPDTWTIIAAGNRASDRAAVNEMPAPVANRFIHFNAEPDLNDFKTWAYQFLKVSQKTIGTLTGFLNFRPELLHASDRNNPAWPSPRTWEWAMKLYENGVDISHVVGESAALQFRAFEKVLGNLPDIEAILKGDSAPSLKSSNDPSVLYATVSALSARAESPEQYVNGISWILDQKVTEDYAGLYLKEVFSILQTKHKSRQEFGKLALSKPKVKAFVVKYSKLESEFSI